MTRITYAIEPGLSFERYAGSANRMILRVQTGAVERYWIMHTASLRHIVESIEAEQA